MFEKLFGLSRPSRPSTLIQSAVDDVCEMLRTSRRMLELSLAALLDNHSTANLVWSLIELTVACMAGAAVYRRRVAATTRRRGRGVLAE